MRVLHVISSLEIGGAQRLLSDILPLMAKENDVTLLVNKEVENDFSHKIKEAGVKIVNCGCPNLHSPKNIFRVARLAKEYDIVHIHLFPTVYWAAFASLITPMKLVYTEHSTLNRRRGKWYFKPIEKFVYSRYKKVISISQQTQEALTGWLDTKAGDPRFVVINNGVNLSSFQDLKEEKLYPKTLIMVSRFVASKDQMTVIRAMKLLPDDVHVIFVGDGENLDNCRTLAKEQGLRERVHFVGKQSNVVSWIAKADIGVQSSNWEGFGLTAVEIMAAGKPIVATNVDGLKQVVEGAGELFEVGDENELAGIIKCLYDDKEEYHRMSKASRARAAEYDIVNTVQRYIELYNIINNEKAIHSC